MGGEGIGMAGIWGVIAPNTGTWSGSTRTACSRAQGTTGSHVDLEPDGENVSKTLCVHMYNEIPAGKEKSTTKS